MNLTALLLENTIHNDVEENNIHSHNEDIKKLFMVVLIFYVLHAR